MTSYVEVSIHNIPRHGSRDLRFEERLKECGLTTLVTEIKSKILNGYENIDYNLFLKINAGKITEGLVKEKS